MEEPIRKKYIFDEENRKIAVQIDMQTFEKIEAILEDFSLGQLIDKNETVELLDLIEAESYYKSLDKNHEN
jgi:hypothetical protein